MLHDALDRLTIAFVAAGPGSRGMAAGAVEVAKVLFFVYLALFVVSLGAGFIVRGP